jgi:hypothetical protein
MAADAYEVHRCGQDAEEMLHEDASYSPRTGHEVMVAIPGHPFRGTVGISLDQIR